MHIQSQFEFAFIFHFVLDKSHLFYEGQKNKANNPVDLLNGNLNLVEDKIAVALLIS